MIDQFLQNSTISFLYAASIFAGSVLVLKAFQYLVKRKLKPLAEETESTVDDKAVALLTSTNKLCLLPVFVYLSSIPLTLPARFSAVIEPLAVTGGAIQVGIWLTGFLTAIIDSNLKKKGGSAASASGLLVFFAKFGVWSLVFLFLLSNFGVDITALVAGLGISGIAVALAVQNILGDLIASLSIVLDKPFAVGDFVIVDNLMGTVEHIGVKTTRVRSLSGEQLIFSNSDLLNSRIRNYKRLYERRIVFTVGVTYQTPKEKLNEIPEIIKGIVTGLKNTRFDRSHFASFGDFSLNFETVYWVLDPDYNMYMDIQQQINLSLYAAFEARGIEFAYPTQTLFVENS